MIIWLIATMICCLYGVEMDIIARFILIPLSFIESICEVACVLVLIKERIKK